MSLIRSLGLPLFIVLLAPASHAQQLDKRPEPKWQKTFSTEFRVVITTVTSEYGVRRNDEGMPVDLGTLDTVDATHSTLLVVEGRPDRAVILHALDAESGAALWQKTSVRLSRWRPLSSSFGQGRTYFVQIVGSPVLLWVTNGKAAGIGCTDKRELVAPSLQDGRLLWCSRTSWDGEVTFVPLPERQTLLAWAASRPGVSLTAIDLRTGVTRWTSS